MILKSIKWAVLTTVAAGAVGGVLFGTELGSYVTTSVRSVREAAKDNVPMEFQLERARHMLDDIIPEMQANIRLVAQQEVEIAGLKADIEQGKRSMDEEQNRVQRLRDVVASGQSQCSFGGLTYSHDELKEQLARRFGMLKEAEVVLTGKERLLTNQERALAAATAAIERTRGQKTLLEGQIASLEAQYRLVQAAATGTKLSLDKSKLAKTERLIADIKKQLDVAEHVLAHEAKFTDVLPADAVVDEKALVAEVDEHFGKSKGEAHVEGRIMTPADLDPH